MTPPFCNITGIDGQCNETRLGHVACQNETWSIAFSAGDDGVGLNAVEPATVNPDANFTIDPFVTGSNVTVDGLYISDCCLPSVTIVASDLLGNAGFCQVDYITEPSDEPEDPEENPRSSLRLMIITLVCVLGVGLVTGLIILAALFLSERQSKTK